MRNDPIGAPANALSDVRDDTVSHDCASAPAAGSVVATTPSMASLMFMHER
jgi:hypothetical protein